MEYSDDERTSGGLHELLVLAEDNIMFKIIQQTMLTIGGGKVLTLRVLTRKQ